jgi:hypothetical protein
MTRNFLPALLLPASVMFAGMTVAQDSNADLLRAAVTFMQAHPHNSGRGVLKVDSRVLAPGVGMRAPLDRDAPAERHDSATLRALEVQSISQVVSPERSAQCAAFAPPDCMQNGASVVAVFARPVIKGDTATIGVILLKSFYVSAADSAARVTRPGGINGVRLARAQQAFGNLTAVREGKVWVVKEFRLFAQS